MSGPFYQERVGRFPQASRTAPGQCPDWPGSLSGQRYFLGRTESLRAFAMRNFNTVFAGILIASPV